MSERAPGFFPERPGKTKEKEMTNHPRSVTAPGFWESLAKFNEEHPREPEPEAGKHRHRGLTVRALVSTCWPCAERKIRYMAEQPEFTHTGRNGRRLAEIHNVAYTPYEERNAAGQEKVGEREQRARERRSE